MLLDSPGGWACAHAPALVELLGPWSRSSLAWERQTGQSVSPEVVTPQHPSGLVLARCPPSPGAEELPGDGQ